MEPTAVKILRIPALVKKLGIGRSTIYDWSDFSLKREAGYEDGGLAGVRS